MTRLTKERIAELYERPRQSTDIDMLYSALNEILAHIAATLPPEAEAPKPERCGGTPGEPRYCCKAAYPRAWTAWHESDRHSRDCRPCPGCLDCAPVKKDWAMDAAEEWYPATHIFRGSIQELATIIRKHATERD